MRKAVVLAFDENYVQPGLVAASTALSNSPPDTELVVLGVDLKKSTVRESMEILHRNNATFIETGEFAQSLPARFVPAAWVRLGLARFLDPGIERVVYLDADTLVRKTLEPLFTMDLNGRVLAAAREQPDPSHQARHDWGTSVDPELDYLREAQAPSVAAYFNSGVLAIDMIRWREADVGPRLEAMAMGLPNAFILPDQDVLNNTLWREWLPLDWQLWNWPGFRLDRLSWETHVAHFAGPTKPWVAEPWGAPFSREYREAALRVGWSLSPRRYRARAGLIESAFPYSVVLRRRRIGAALRR